MTEYSKLLTGLAMIIGLSSGSSAFADSIHGALKSDRNTSQEITRTISGRPSSTPWTINDYVKAYRATVDARNSVKTQEIAGIMKPYTRGWQEALGNPPKL